MAPFAASSYSSMIRCQDSVDEITAFESMGLQLDCLVAAMRDDADVREKMLAATTSQEIQQVAHSLGQLLGETIEVTPIQLREAIRGD
jgi:hypothetical protein